MVYTMYISIYMEIKSMNQIYMGWLIPAMLHDGASKSSTMGPMDHLPAGPKRFFFQLATSRCFDGGDGGGIGGRGNSIGLPGEGLHGLGR